MPNKVFGVDFPPTAMDIWTLVTNEATALDATKRGNAKAVLVTVEDAAIRYCIDGSTASGDDRSVANGGHVGHKVAADGYFHLADPTRKAMENLSMVNAASNAAATLQITYF